MLQFTIDILITLAVFAAGYLVCYISILRSIGRRLLEQRHAEEIKKNMKVINHTVKLKHEVIDGVNYFYEDSTDNFIAQGTTLDDAAKNYTMSAGPDSLGVFYSKQDKKAYCFYNGKLMDLHNG